MKGPIKSKAHLKIIEERANQRRKMQWNRRSENLDDGKNQKLRW